MNRKTRRSSAVTIYFTTFLDSTIWTTVLGTLQETGAEKCAISVLIYKVPK